MTHVGVVTAKPALDNGYAWRIDCAGGQPDTEGKWTEQDHTHFLGGIDRPMFKIEVGDTVTMEYRTGPGYGLWFVARAQ